MDNSSNGINRLTAIMTLQKSTIFLIALLDCFCGYWFQAKLSNCEYDAKEDSIKEDSSWKTEATFWVNMIHILLMISAVLPRTTSSKPKATPTVQRWEVFTIAYVFAGFAMHITNILWALHFNKCSSYIAFLFTESTSVLTYMISEKTNSNIYFQALWYVLLYSLKNVIVLSYLINRKLWEEEVVCIEEEENFRLGIQGMEGGIIGKKENVFVTRQKMNLKGVSTTVFIISGMLYFSLQLYCNNIF